MRRKQKESVRAPFILLPATPNLLTNTGASVAPCCRTHILKFVYNLSQIRPVGGSRTDDGWTGQDRTRSASGKSPRREPRPCILLHVGAKVCELVCTPGFLLPLGAIWTPRDEQHLPLKMRILSANRWKPSSPHGRPGAQPKGCLETPAIQGFGFRWEHVGNDGDRQDRHDVFRI